MKRHFFYRHCWVIALLSAVVLGTLAWLYGPADRGALIGMVVAASFGFCYFAHQQKLEETKLLKTLVTEFNKRYDDMNGELAEIEAQPGELTQQRREKIVDYFNLCAEEYFFQSEGYIHDRVWESWCRGMLYYLKREPFCSVWEEEQRKDSYYGLTRRVIEEGARQPPGWWDRLIARFFQR